MQTRTFRSVLIPPTILVFYVWLAIFLDENAIYLPLSAQISVLNFLLGKVEWLFLYLWMVGFLYVLLGEKLSERRRETERVKPWRTALCQYKQIKLISATCYFFSYCRLMRDIDRVATEWVNSQPLESEAQVLSYPFLQVFQFSIGQQRLEASNWELACRTNPLYD